MKTKRPVESFIGKKDGEGYIYPQFLARENFNNAHKIVQKSSEIVKRRIHNVVNTGTNNFLALYGLRRARMVLW